MATLRVWVAGSIKHSPATQTLRAAGTFPGGGAAGLGRWFNKAFTRSPDPPRRWKLRGYSGRGITGYASLQ